MGKELGAQKTGGRKKGTPNKRSLGFNDILEERGINLLSELLDASQEIPDKERVALYLDLLPYQYPKRKALEAPTLSLPEQIAQLTREEMLKTWDHLGQRLGLNLEASEMDEKQLLEMRSTIDDLLRLKKLESELGAPDNVT